MKLTKKKLISLSTLLLIFALVLSSAILSFGIVNPLNSSAYTSSTLPKSIGSITLNDYSTRPDNKVFDGIVLDKLYNAILGSTSATYDDLLTAVNNSISETIGTTYNSVKNINTQSKSMNFAQIASSSGQEAITIEFGGYTWNIVYLTTNTLDGSDGNSKQGDLIATLWLSETLDNTTYKFNDYSSANTANPYPSSMYSTSKIRVHTLNGGGAAGANYAVSTTELTGTQADRENHIFAAFTMPSSTAVGQRSLTQFIAQPESVVYQRAENWSWSNGKGTRAGYLSPNEAWGDGTDGITGPDVSIKHTDGGSGWYTNSNNAQTDNVSLILKKTEYYDWKSDYLWLPSATEIGPSMNDYSSTSLWGIPNGKTIGKDARYSWMRSGANMTGTNAWCKYANGGYYSELVTNNYSIRPALHLNLTQAQKSIAREQEAPSDVSIEYAGKALKIDQDSFANSTSEFPAWYDADKMDLSYETADMTDVGDYNVTVSLKQEFVDKGGVFSGSFNAANGETATSRKIKFKITPRKLSPVISVENNAPKVTLPQNSIYARDVGTDRAPVWAFTYRDNATGTIYNDWPNKYGAYTINLRIGNSTTCNYALADGTQSITVELKIRVNFDPDVDELVWLANDAEIKDNKLTYIPGGYNISIGQYIKGGDSLEQRGLKLDRLSITKATNAATYNVTAYLSNKNSEFESKNFEVNYTFEIEKAKYDLSQVKWNYDASKLVYNGSPHTLLLKDVPAGLTPSYHGNSATDVHADKYTATVVSFSNADTSNYVTPDRNNTDSYIGDFDWTFDWNVTPQEISTASWADVAHDFNGTAGTIPKLFGWDEYVSYEFEEWNVATQTGTPIELADIRIELGVEKWYRVKAVIKNPSNYNYAIGTQDNPHVFSLGSNKTAVTITVKGSGQTFDGLPKLATLTTSTLSPTEDFDISYYDMNDRPLTGAPVHAGTYKVVVTLKSNRVNDYYIANSEPVEFVINKATVDLSGISWNYNAEAPFQYQRKDGSTLAHRVELIGWDSENALHEYIKGFIVYSGNVEEGEVSSRYSASFDFDGLELGDFVAFDLPISKTLSWRIVKRKIQKPVYDGENLIFANEDIDLLELFGITEDWAEYFTITAKYNNDVMTGYTGRNVGTYSFVCEFLSEIGEGNVAWDDNDTFAVTPSVRIDARVITITGWSNDRIPSPIVEDEIDLEFINRVYTDMNGNVVTRDEINKTYNTSFRVTAESKYGDNVIVRVAEEVNDFAEFSTPADPNKPLELVQKPTLTTDTLAYTGNPVTFELNGFDDTIMIIVGSLTVTDEGEYTLIVRFRDGVNYCWEDNTRDPLTFTLKVVNDPNNPVPPEKPGEDGNVLDKIKDFFENLIASNFPLWQVATSAVALLFTLIFMIKAIQYGNRKKKAKGEAKKYNAKTYAALLPIFSTQTVWLNLSNMIWSIIAFSLCGVMLLMFITMVITRKGWKKAELAKETAIEESEQRKTEAMEAKQLAFQERISSQNFQSVDNSALESLRREMEERHRQEMEAMKIMLANMMGRAQGDNGMPAYASMEDTDLLADKVFERLLPAVQQMIPEPTAYLAAPSSDSDNNELIAIVEQQKAIVDVQNEEIKMLTAQVASMQQKMDMMSEVAIDEFDDNDYDDEEEWDSILDEDDDDFVEAVIIEEDGTVKKTYPNFRMRLKQSSDKNREWYAAVKNLFCSQKGVTYRVYKRVEKIRYQGQVIAVIGIAKRSIKLWLALKPYEYDARRYHHKDVSDKPRFVDVPMYVRVSSDRALTRAQELILALFQELNMEARKRYNDRSIQELIFTLKHNKLLTNKQNKGLLCEVMHVHDCDVLSDELAEKCIESKNVESIDESLIETLKLDDIDAKFQDGNRVTLEKLKKVGLVSEECTGYTVTAGQRLTKPLIIVANDFTLPAVKMITLTGGRAIKLNQVK